MNFEANSGVRRRRVITETVNKLEKRAQFPSSLINKNAIWPRAARTALKHFYIIDFAVLRHPPS